MTEILTFQASMCEIGSKELMFCDFQTPWPKFKINLLDNTISKNYLDSSYPENATITIGKQCNKYHFYYNGTASLIKGRLTVSDITLDKYHFVRIHGPLHFVVNGNLIKSSTSIRITTPGFNTKEIILPFTHFDLSSKKKIDTKLKTIQLLG